jgi:ribosomal-protein-alanine N-acetyltransferase
MYIHKNGLSLIKVSKKDLSLLKDLKNESWFGTHNIYFVNDTDQENWFNNLNPSKQLVLIAVNTQTQEQVGLFKIDNIDWINRKCSEGHDTFKNQRGKGYGKLILEAGIDFVFEVLNMNRVEAEVLENNIASQKCCSYIEYPQEGRRKKAIHKCGEYLDSIIYGFLREDWVQTSRVKDKYQGICNLSYIPKNN